MRKKCFISDTKGIAMAFVAGAVLILPVILFSVHNYVSSKTRDMAWITARKKLEHHLLAALRLADAKLKKERWYGNEGASGTFELTEDGVKVTVYCDDYVQTKRRQFSTPEPGLYLMLDHIKVFAEARMDNFSFFAYGKFVITPEPLYQGRRTTGIDYHEDDFMTEANTLKQLVNIRMGNPQEYTALVSGFKSLTDKNSRQLLGRHFDSEADAIARNYYHVTRMQPAISRMFGARFQSFSKPMFRSLVKSLETYSDLENPDILKNHFIADNFRRFVPGAEFNITEEKRLIIAKDVSIRSAVPEKNAQEPEKRKLLRSVFGAEHPISAEPNSAHPRSWYFTADQKATERFLTDLSPRTQSMEEPSDFINNNFRFVAANAYRFVWEARCSSQVERGGVELFDRYFKDWQSGKFLFKDPHCGTSPDFQLGKKTGPEPVFGDYFIRHGERGPEFSVAAVLNLFRKMVDGSSFALGPDKNTELFAADVTASRAGGAVRFIY